MWRLLLGTMGVKSLVQGLNAAATAGFEPRTVWSEVRRRNRLATAPPITEKIFRAQVLSYLKALYRATARGAKWSVMMSCTIRLSRSTLPQYASENRGKIRRGKIRRKMSSVGRASGNFGVGHPKFQPGTIVPSSRFANRVSFDANRAVCPVCPVLEWPLQALWGEPWTTRSVLVDGNEVVPFRGDVTNLWLRAKECKVTQRRQGPVGRTSKTKWRCRSGF